MCHMGNNFDYLYQKMSEKVSKKYRHEIVIKVTCLCFGLHFPRLIPNKFFKLHKSLANLKKIGKHISLNKYCIVNGTNRN